MKVLISGGLGYLGVKLANKLVSESEVLGEKIEKIILLDIKDDTPNKALLSKEHDIIVSDLSSIEDIPDVDTIFHFGSAVSAACQKNPELGIKNVNATETILKAATNHRIKVVFPSSILAFENIERVTDETEPNSSAPYGKSKVESEKLCNEYADRVNVRGLRLPTVIAGREPTSAATAYAYNLPNHLMRGKDFTIPVLKSYRMPLIWIEDVIDSFIKIHNLDENELVKNGNPYRIMNLSGISPTTEEWLSEILSFAKENNISTGNISWTEDKFVKSICDLGPKYFEGKRAEELGMKNRVNMQNMIKRIADAI